MLTILNIGEVKTAKDDRDYYGVEFKDSANPFSKPAKRIIFQRTTAAGNVWDANPADIAKLKGKAIPGAIVSKQVPEYSIVTSDGEERTVNTYTTVVFGHENELSVFKSAGHDFSLLSKEPADETADDVAEPALV